MQIKMNCKSALCGLWLAGFCAFSTRPADQGLTKEKLLVFVAVFLTYLLFCYAGIRYRNKIKSSDKNNLEPKSQWTAES